MKSIRRVQSIHANDITKVVQRRKSGVIEEWLGWLAGLLEVVGINRGRGHDKQAE